MRSHMAAKCHCVPAPSQPPSVMPLGKRNGSVGYALWICHPLIIMRIMAAALIQCVILTIKGWTSPCGGIEVSLFDAIMAHSRIEGPRFRRGPQKAEELREQNGIDHMDHTVLLIHIGDR